MANPGWGSGNEPDIQTQVNKAVRDIIVKALDTHSRRELCMVKDWLIDPYKEAVYGVEATTFVEGGGGGEIVNQNATETTRLGLHPTSADIKDTFKKYTAPLNMFSLDVAINMIEVKASAGNGNLYNMLKGWVRPNIEQVIRRLSREFVGDGTGVASTDVSLQANKICKGVKAICAADTDYFLGYTSMGTDEVGDYIWNPLQNVNVQGQTWSGGAISEQVLMAGDAAKLQKLGKTDAILTTPAIRNGLRSKALNNKDALVISNGTDQLVDRWRGIPIITSPWVDTGYLYMLDMDNIQISYHPDLWVDPTETLSLDFESTPGTNKLVAQILMFWAITASSRRAQCSFTGLTEA